MKPRRSMLGLASWLIVLLLPALACNLPSRQPAPLPFGTDQYLSPSPQPMYTAGIPFPLSTENTAVVTPAGTELGGLTHPFPGIQTATPGVGVPPSQPTDNPGTVLPPFTYITQSGDTLPALAARFGVSPDQIGPPQPAAGLLPIGQTLTIPNLVGEPAYPSAVLPDSAILYSPIASDFRIEDYIAQAGGYLSTYTENVDGETLSGAEIVRRVAVESSINPQLLLAFLEFRSGWVRGQPYAYTQVEYPIGFYVPEYKGLYLELSLVAKELNIGYYGWRAGTLTELSLPDYTHVRISPSLNAGSVALQVLTGMFYLHRADWLESLYGSQGVVAIYSQMFGDPWQAAFRVEPLFPDGLSQPGLELPFAPGEYWSLTSGPHTAWRTGTPRGALDLAPITGEPPCVVSRAWVTASAPGRVVRSERGVVALDLDGDGLEQTGLVLIYMHIAEQDRVPLDTWVDTNDRLGHPSCEGGTATGTNVHLARKYNGEWLAADEPLPMVLSGWVAHQGKLSYEGTLEKDGHIVSARPDGSAGSTIIR
ncbi:MAG TPA: LysM peptidoglycan-binding domain-containing protein [Anaerolineales bacterium]|nr:LysM peptidoglycan-binding domain-containing protein [Anaerolineales bacterium]